jgi:hypothetical protein
MKSTSGPSSDSRSWPLSLLMSAMTTRHCFARRWRVGARPIPEAAPVMIATGLDISSNVCGENETKRATEENRGCK